MAKTKRKARRSKAPQFRMEADLPTPEQLAQSEYVRDFVTHAETNTKAMTHRKRDSSILEKWMREEGPGFDHGSQRVIRDCITLWARMAPPSTTARYGERMASSTGTDGQARQDAMDEMRYRRSLLPAGMQWAWDVFENVVRHNEPAGVAGSSIAKAPAQSIQSAKVITGMVASFIAARMGY